MILKKILFSLLFLFMIAACKKEKAPVPTLQNIVGTWQMTSYSRNGVAASSSEMANNFFLFNFNYSFSARVGSGSNESYFFGDMKIEGQDIIISGTDGVGLALHVNEISPANLSLKTSINNENYEMVMTRVTNPTLYKVQNKTGDLVSITTFYFDNAVRDLAYHGALAGGTSSSNKVFTKRDRIILGIEFAGHKYAGKYAQLIHPGQENTLILADTTTVFELGSNAGLSTSSKLPSGQTRLTTIKDILSDQKN